MSHYDEEYDFGAMIDEDDLPAKYNCTGCVEYPNCDDWRGVAYDGCINCKPTVKELERRKLESEAQKHYEDFAAQTICQELQNMKATLDAISVGGPPRNNEEVNTALNLAIKALSLAQTALF